MSYKETFEFWLENPYFDEETNEVKAKQGEGPAIQLEVVSCSQS